MNIIELAAQVHQQHEKWWVDLETGARIKRNAGEIIALVHSEISEAYEGEADYKMDDHLPHRVMAEVEMADAFIRVLDYIGGTGIALEVAAQMDSFPKTRHMDNHINLKKKIERIVNLHHQCSMWLEAARKGKPTDYLIANLLVGLQNYCTAFGYDLASAMQEKLAYNLQRADHKLEHRKSDAGKKF